MPLTVGHLMRKSVQTNLALTLTVRQTHFSANGSCMCLAEVHQSLSASFESHINSFDVEI